MPRKRRSPALGEAPTADLPPLVLHPDLLLTGEQFRRWFGLRESSLYREVREGRLRVSKRCGRYYVLGSDILDWLRSGVCMPDAAEQEPSATADHHQRNGHPTA